MKQKLVIKVQMNCDKCRSKAMKIASTATDVINSIAIEGSDRDQLVVIGEGVDSANLTCSLRKKFCYAALWSVEEVKVKKELEVNPPKPKDVKKQSSPENTSSTSSIEYCPQFPMCPQYPPYPIYMK
ncbi:hypothetical protein ACB098_06G007800 [Castanea mollissima]